MVDVWMVGGRRPADSGALVTGLAIKCLPWVKASQSPSGLAERGKRAKIRQSRFIKVVADEGGICCGAEVWALGRARGASWRKAEKSG